MLHSISRTNLAVGSYSNSHLWTILEEAMKTNFEVWPGLEHLAQNKQTKQVKIKVGPKLKKLDLWVENLLDSIVMKIDSHSALGEWGVRFCLVSSLTLMAFGKFQAATIPMIVLLGSFARQMMESQQILPKEELKQSTSEEIQKAVFNNTSLEVHPTTPPKPEN